MFRPIRIIPLILAALLAACVRDPSPEAFGKPEFKRVTVLPNEGAVEVECQVTSMSQLTEYGMYFAPVEEDGRVAGWERIPGKKRDETGFTVRKEGLAAGTNYSYRLYLGNGRTEISSAQNYYYHDPEGSGQ